MNQFSENLGFEYMYEPILRKSQTQGGVRNQFSESLRQAQISEPIIIGLCL